MTQSPAACTGLSGGPQKIHPPGTCEDVIKGLKGRPFWIRVALNPRTSVLMIQKTRHRHKEKARLGQTQTWSDASAGQGAKVRRSHQRLESTGWTFPRNLRRSSPPPPPLPAHTWTLDFSSPKLRENTFLLLEATQSVVLGYSRKLTHPVSPQVPVRQACRQAGASYSHHQGERGCARAGHLQGQRCPPPRLTRRHTQGKASPELMDTEDGH